MPVAWDKMRLNAIKYPAPSKPSTAQVQPDGDPAIG